MKYKLPRWSKNLGIWNLYRPFSYLDNGLFIKYKIRRFKYFIRYYDVLNRFVIGICYKYHKPNTYKSNIHKPSN